MIAKCYEAINTILKELMLSDFLYGNRIMVSIFP